jgi:hypothetical protein
LLHIHLEDPYAYALLTFLCHAANNSTGQSWHGFQSIAYTTGMGTRAIRSATRKLVELGLIEAQLRGRQETKLYCVRHNALLALAESSKAGRVELLTNKQDKKSERQCAKAPSLSQSDSAPAHQVTVRQSKSGSALKHPVTVRQSTPNYVSELSKGTEEEELDACASENSGSIDFQEEGQSMELCKSKNPGKTQTSNELGAELARLRKRRNQSISDGKPTAYRELTAQIAEVQTAYNRARTRDAGLLPSQSAARSGPRGDVPESAAHCA